LRNQRGQGTIEYLLVLIVAIAIIFGLLYQLNTAFKSWANNYFGDYLACLLETGEVPNFGGGGGAGGAGLCDQLFKAFSLADGRPYIGPQAQGGGAQDGGNAGGQREPRRGAGRVGGGGGGYGGGGGRFGAGRRAPGSAGRPLRKAGGSTGNMGTSDYGGGYSTFQRPQRFKTKDNLNNQFAFDDGQGRQTQRKIAATNKKSSDDDQSRPPLKLKPKGMKAKTAIEGDSGFTIGNFIKWIIIIGLILALILFLGGQALSISKSMD